MMKRFNAWMEKVGVDRLLHFSIGAWITALGGMYNHIGCLYCGGLIIILNIIKERLLDDNADYKDVFATSLGSVTSIIICYIINITKQLLCI